MTLDTIQLGTLAITRFILGGNPFSGFSHQGEDRDAEMMRFFTADRILSTFKQAEELGINTFLGRGDQHIIRLLMEYRDNGGNFQWIAQTCPEMQSIEKSVERIIQGGAQACFIHGGVTDYLYANNLLDRIPPVIDMIKSAGLPAGIAGHNPQVFEWAEDHIDADFYMCSYYNASHRDEHAEHISGMPEWFKSEDRDIMTGLIQKLKKPVIHYKILAAGRNDPREAFAFAARRMRDSDAVCVGIYQEGKPEMIEEDLRLFNENLED